MKNKGGFGQIHSLIPFTAQRGVLALEQGSLEVITCAVTRARLKRWLDSGCS